MRKERDPLKMQARLWNLERNNVRMGKDLHRVMDLVLELKEKIRKLEFEVGRVSGYRARWCRMSIV